MTPKRNAIRLAMLLALVPPSLGGCADVPSAPEGEPTITFVSVGATTVEMNSAAGDTAWLIGVAQRSDGVYRVVRQWETLDPQVATVDSTGIVTVHASGRARIVGSAGELADTAEFLVVIDRPWARILEINGQKPRRGSTTTVADSFVVTMEINVPALADSSVIGVDLALDDGRHPLRGRNGFPKYYHPLGGKYGLKLRPGRTDTLAFVAYNAPAGEYPVIPSITHLVNGDSAGVYAVSTVSISSDVRVRVTQSDVARPTLVIEAPGRTAEWPSGTPFSFTFRAEDPGGVNGWEVEFTDYLSTCGAIGGGSSGPRSTVWRVTMPAAHKCFLKPGRTRMIVRAWDNGWNLGTDTMTVDVL